MASADLSGSFVQAGAVFVVAIVGAAAGGMRRWAKGVRTEIRDSTGEVTEKLGEVADRLDRTDDRLDDARERLAYVEGLEGVPRSRSLPRRRARAQVGPTDPGTP